MKFIFAFLAIVCEFFAVVTIIGLCSESLNGTAGTPILFIVYIIVACATWKAMTTGGNEAKQDGSDTTAVPFNQTHDSNCSTETRPSSVSLGTKLLAFYIVMGSVLSLVTFFVACSEQDSVLIDVTARICVGSSLRKVFLLLFAWKALKGRNWARILINFAVSFATVLAGMVAIVQQADQSNGMIQLNPTLLRYNWIFFIMSVFLGIGALYHLNSRDARKWFHLSKAQKRTENDSPWWIVVLLLLIICPILVFLKAVNKPIQQEHRFTQERQNTSVSSSFGNKSSQELKAPANNQAPPNSIPSNPPKETPRGGISKTSMRDQDFSLDEDRQYFMKPSRNEETSSKQVSRPPIHSNNSPVVQTEVIDGLVWLFTVKDGKAFVGVEDGSSTAISKQFAGELIIPNSLGGYPVVGISKGAFWGCRIEQVRIHHNVTTIDECAFFECKQLRSAILENGISSIEWSAFSDCEQLDSIHLPDSITRIGNRAFSGCKSLTAIVLPPNIREIGINPFAKCSNLNTIHLNPDNAYFVVHEGELFDREKKSLIAFPPHKWIQDCTIPNGVREIGESAFEEIGSIKQCHFPNSLTTIQASAFDGCKELRKVEIPASVAQIGSNPFRGCVSLSEITVANGNTHFFSKDGVLYDRENRTLLSYPAGKLDNRFTVANGTQTIGEWAFAGCTQLTTISMPASISSIQSFAFVGSNLEYVTFFGNCPTISQSAFMSSSYFRRGLKFFVPRQSNGWKDGIPGADFISIQYRD